MTRQKLEAVLAGLGPVAVAVSGGVDSLTLATLAHRLAPGTTLVVHAVSPAVPEEATARVRAEGAREGWALRVIEAGEFADPAYRANPVNRCFFCKTNLYGAVRAVTDRQILSGANRDDLGEYRPGLDAAREHGVRHPYVEAGFDKASVRALARDLGLGAVAELPAAPCLSSRVETGIPIEPETLGFIHAVERLVAPSLRGPAPSGRSAAGCAPRAWWWNSIPGAWRPSTRTAAPNSGPGSGRSRRRVSPARSGSRPTGSAAPSWCSRGRPVRERR